MQGRHSSWFVAMAVVLLGIFAAFTFQRRPVEEPREEDSVDFSYLADSLIWKEERVVSDDDQGAPYRQRLGPLVHDQGVAAVAATESSESRVPEPPRMADQYGGLAEAYQANPAVGPPQVASKVTADEPGRTNAPVSPPRLHRIVDGDTLASIASRYWGDVSRADELFAANRDVLSDPELLPVGREIRIPPRAAGARGGTSPRDPSRRDPGPRDSGALTPLRGLPQPAGTSVRGEERPSLLRPATTRTSSGRGPQQGRGDSAREPARLQTSPRTNLRPLP
jgi:hypothetical protein